MKGNYQLVWGVIFKIYLNTCKRILSLNGYKLILMTTENISIDCPWFYGSVNWLNIFLCYNKIYKFYEFQKIEWRSIKIDIEKL